MGRIALSAGILLLCAAAAAQVAPRGSLAPAERILGNGMRVFIIEDHSAPLVMVKTVFRAGSVSQGPGDAGVMHLLEHMIFEGCERYPSAAAMAAARTAMGVSSYNAVTRDGSTDFWSVQPSGNVAAALEYWTAAFEAPLFDPAVLETARQALLNEIGNGSSLRPAELLFSAAPWRKDVRGYPSAIKAASADALKALFLSCYRPSEAALFLAGDLSPGPELDELLERSMGRLRAGGPPRPPQGPAFAPPPSPILCLAQSPGVEDGRARLDFYYLGPDMGTGSADARPAEGALDVLSVLLSDPWGSLSVRLKKSLGATDIGSGIDIEGDGSVISLWALVKPPRGTPAWRYALDSAIPALRSEFGSMAGWAASYFGPEALDAARARIRDSFALSKADPFEWAGLLQAIWTAGSADVLDPDRPDALAALDWPDIEALISSSLHRCAGVTLLTLSPADYAREAADARRSGYRDAGDLGSWWTGRRGGAE